MSFIKLDIRHFHVAVVQGRQRNVKKKERDARAELLICSTTILFFERLRRRRRC